MADMIRAATPITNKNIVQPLREHHDADIAPFDLQDPSKIVKTLPDSELLKQNTGNIEKQTAPEILMDLLKDPSVTVNFIKNILMLQEIVGLISMQNAPVTEEIEQLFAQLAVKPENLPQELIRQENSSTAFKGELFDFLRNMVKENPSPELKNAVINVLKAVNSENTKQDVLKALSGTMKYLSETLSPNKELSDRLANLSVRFRSESAESDFPVLKHETALVMQDIEKSIMFSKKLSCLTSMVTYNLSRYNTNTSFLKDAASEFLMFIPEDNKRAGFLQMLYNSISGHGVKTSNSKVLDVLIKILEKQTDSESVMQMKGESVESVIHSLLSSPSNFTPLLHFIVPIDDGQSKAFGEMWINPDEDNSASSKNQSGDVKRTIHMLLVFDIPDIGRFETELYVRDKKIDMSLLCPAVMQEKFDKLSVLLKESISFSDYSFNDIRVSKLEKSRSLIEVFPTLPQKRTGINVRI